MVSEKGKIAGMHWTYYLHLAIGLGFMFLFPMLDPIEPITEVGMKVLGAFVGMVYLWSTVNSVWPSLLGLILVAFSGYVGGDAGYNDLKTVFLNAFGAETALLVMMGMFLFGLLDYVGCTKYICRFFIERKSLEGKPYLFCYVLFLCSAIIAGFIDPLASLLMLWPIAVQILKMFGYKKGDKFFYFMICGVYLGATLGQPMVPFKGVAFVVVNIFSGIFQSPVNYIAYLCYNLIMTMLILLCYVLFARFVLRPDVEAFKSLKASDVFTEKLPKMNAQQIASLITMAVFVAAILLPTISPAFAFINKFSVLGITCVCIIVLMIIPYKGQPMLDLRGIGRSSSFSWDIFFLVAAALYICSALTMDVTGIKPFLVQLLTPLLGGKSEFIFILIVLIFALVTTNFANNVGMFTVILPIILVFSQQYPGIDTTILCMTVANVVFIALATPAASPYCGMLHARKDLVTFKEISILFIPTLVFGLLLYLFVGYYVVAPLLF